MKLLSLVLCVALTSSCHGQKNTASTASSTSHRTVQHAPARFYGIRYQQPITDVPSPASLFSRRLPADIMKHLMPDDVGLALHALTACAGNGICSNNIYIHHVGSNEVTELPTYYGTASDPVYVIRSAGHFPPSSYNPIGVPFHCTEHAQFSSGSTDQYFLCWDQTSNKVVSLFCYGHSSCRGRKLPSCSSTDVRRPCDIGFSPTYAMVNDRDDANGYGAGPGNPYASNSMTAPVGEIRVEELIQGHIYHALYLNTVCQRGTPVFPTIFGYAAAGCTPRGYHTEIAPPAGALVFLDYTDAQLAQLKSYMPAWQYPIVEALSHYGGYVGDTGNPLHPSRLEGEEAYLTAGIADPIFAWLQGQPAVNQGCGFKDDCVLPWANFAVGGNACPAAGLCDITQHLHIADPCVAAGMADEILPSRGGAVPEPCVSSLSVAVAGAGSVSSDPPGMNCDRSSECNLTASFGRKVTLTAHPQPGHTFAGWGGRCAKYRKRPCILKLGKNRSPLGANATFEPQRK